MTPIAVADRGPPELGAKLHAIGHPYAGLKKWSRAEVFDVESDWIWTDGLVGPGNSGSPVFDEAGQLVGVATRAGVTADADGLSTVTLLVPVAHLASLLTSPGQGLDALPDLSGAYTLDRVRALEPNLFGAQQVEVMTSTAVGGAWGRVPELLAEICDAALAGPDPLTVEAADSLYEDCVTPTRWLHCEPGADERFLYCPDSLERREWTTRVQQARFLIQRIEPDADSQLARIEAFVDNGFRTLELEQWVAPEPPALEAPLSAVDVARNIAWTLQDGGVLRRDYIEAVKGFQELPGYGRDALHVLYAAIMLMTKGALDADEVKGIAQDLLHDPSLTMSVFVRLEYTIWLWDIPDVLD